MCAAFAEENDHMAVFSFRALYDAYLSCRQRKRNSHNTLKFEADLFGNLLASYLGHFKHADSYRLMRGIFKSFPFLSELFLS